MSLAGARLVRYLLDIGAVDTASVVDGELMVSDSTRRHLNHKVRLRSPAGCFVKQARADQALSQSTLHREAMCYWLAGNDPHFAALAPLLPRYVAYDRARQTLVLELLPGAENLSELQQRLGRVPVETAAGLGLALGRAQAGVRDPGPQQPGVYVFPRTVPWVLNIHALISSQVDRLSSANAHLLAIIRQYPEFPAALEALRAGWRNERLIHGDMKWDNCLVLDRGELAHGTPSQPLRLRVIDWELADFGDGLWDVGGIFHSFLCCWLMSMPPHDEASVDQLLGSARHPIEGMQPAMHAFWHAYLEGAGLASADSAPLLMRSMQYAAARMIQTAYEALSYAPSITPATLRLLQVSLNILTRPGDALADLLDLPAMGRPAGAGLRS
jgi:hypothetical protein